MAAIRKWLHFLLGKWRTRSWTRFAMVVRRHSGEGQDMILGMIAPIVTNVRSAIMKLGEQEGKGDSICLMIFL